MTNTKYTPPVYAEEKIIYQEQGILNEQKIIPQGFIELTTFGKSHSTKELELPKDPCWRYNFAYEDGKKWLMLDIPQELLEKLNLKPGEKCSNLAFIPPEVLKREAEYGGINLQNEKELFLVPPGSKLFREKETQTGLNGEEITGLEEKLEGVNKKYNQLRSDTSSILYPEANVSVLAILDEHLITQAQEVIDKLNNLRTEKNQWENQNRGLQQNIVTLQNEINRLNNTLQTTQEERDQVQGDLNTLTNNWDNLQTQINQLTSQINDLTIERDNRPNITHQEYNDLVQARDSFLDLITNVQNLLGVNNLNNLPQIPQGETLNSLLERPTLAQLNTLKREEEDLIRERNDMRTQRDNRPDIALTQWNNDYSRRPTQQQLTNLQQEKTNLQAQLNSVRMELNNTKNERDDYQRRWNNHTCPSTSCSRRHCDSSCGRYCNGCKNIIHEEVSYRRVNRDDPERE